MNTRDIERILQRYAPLFRGVFSCDTLPSSGRGLMVSNTDPHDQPGSHWIAIYIDDEGKHGEYFDSLGRAPGAIFRNYMDRHCENWTFNEKQLQSIASRFCGHYCVFYCLCRCRGINMRAVASSFTNDTGFNDVLVHELICH